VLFPANEVLSYLLVLGILCLRSACIVMLHINKERGRQTFKVLCTEMVKGGTSGNEKMFARQKRCSIKVDVGNLVANRWKGKQSVIITVRTQIIVMCINMKGACLKRNEVKLKATREVVGSNVCWHYSQFWVGGEAQEIK
jgi:hypothetical protein